MAWPYVLIKGIGSSNVNNYLEKGIKHLCTQVLPFTSTISCIF